MTAALEGVSGQQHGPAALYPRERPDTHFTGGWTEMITRSVSWGGKGGRCVKLATLLPSCADYLEIWEPQPPGNPQGLPRSVMGLLYLYQCPTQKKQRFRWPVSNELCIVHYDVKENTSSLYLQSYWHAAFYIPDKSAAVLPGPFTQCNERYSSAGHKGGVTCESKLSRVLSRASSDDV